MGGGACGARGSEPGGAINFVFVSDKKV